MKLLTLVLLPAALFAGQNRYARLGDFEGQVDVQLSAADYWMPAERNLPLPESTWVRTGPSSRVEIELDDGGVLRLGPDSQGGLADYTRLSTGQRITLVSLDHGLAYFTGRAQGKDAVTLSIPGAQVVFHAQASVRLQAEDEWSEIAILNGVARFSSPAAELDLPQGQTTRVEPAHPARFFLYREVAELDLDRWSAARDKTLRPTAAEIRVAERYGLADLDAAGAWIATEDLGIVWKPKVAESWAPFQNGRWRWYGALGYTWVSADAWGWLPFHYGRWARSNTLGWVWAPPSGQALSNPVFKPGDVYWLRGAKFVAWGPLAPGEQWMPPDSPRQFLNANTTYADFEADADLIDPAGYADAGHAERPKEPLKVAAFAVALPSPAFPASKLDALRPDTLAGNSRVQPVLPGVTFQSVTEAPAVLAEPAPQRTRPQPPAPAPPAQSTPETPPEQVFVPVPVEGIVVVNQPAPVPANLAPARPQLPQTKAPAPAPLPRKPATSPVASTPPAGPRHGPPGRKPKDDAEQQLYTQVLKELNQNPAKAVEDLDSWARQYPRSDFTDVRQVYYMQASSTLGHPASVLQYGSELMAKDLAAVLDPGEMLSALYLITANVRSIMKPNRTQVQLGRQAARNLIDYLPEYFREERRPRETATAIWERTRVEIQTMAQETLKALSSRGGL